MTEGGNDMAKKRANGEGSMRKLGQSWEIRVMDG
jgi:hypothetical protein